LESVLRAAVDQVLKKTAPPFHANLENGKPFLLDDNTPQTPLDRKSKTT
jgi:hypothetical protein